MTKHISSPKTMGTTINNESTTLENKSIHLGLWNMPFLLIGPVHDDFKGCILFKFQ